jgi:hypothetical protein
MGFNRTLERVLAMDPDRLSIYNYAHLPSLFKPQRRIPTPTCRRPIPPADSRAGHPQADRGRLRLHRHGPLSPSPTTNWPSPSARGACTAISRAIRPTPTAICWPSASRRSARSGRPTARTSRRSTNTTTASTTDPAGLPRHRAERRRHPAALDHPGADVPLRTVDRSRSRSPT